MCMYNDVTYVATYMYVCSYNTIMFISENNTKNNHRKLYTAITHVGLLITLAIIICMIVIRCWIWWKRKSKFMHIYYVAMLSIAMSE